VKRARYLSIYRIMSCFSLTLPIKKQGKTFELVKCKKIRKV
jgi:hypothetical protein